MRFTSTPGKPFQMAGRAFTALIVAAGLTLTASAAPDLNDDAITAKAEEEFLFDPAVPSEQVDVKTLDGIVTLDGAVDNLLAKDRAERIAETIKGVRSVVNRIEVQPAEHLRDDGEIETDVVAALIEDPATDSFEIGVDVEDGVATLTGTVDSWRERDLAETVVKGVAGIEKIENKILVEYETERPDLDVQREIEKALQWDVLVADGLIDVSVEDGHVKLSGTVGSAAEKHRAERKAWVAGVESVDTDELTVAKWARDERLRKQKYPPKSADEIRDAIENALMYDPRVYSFDVTPEVAGSVVTLRGTVDNLKAKRAAEQDAKNTVGVSAVTNLIEVEPAAGLSDVQIGEKVRDAIERDPFLERYEITAVVVDGEALLTGVVDSHFEKAQAEEVASTVEGVLTVDNQLKVRTNEDDLPYTYDPYVDPYDIYGFGWYDYEPADALKTDAEIEEAIHDELWWSPFVDADQVNVVVDGGRAQLSGSVETWAERQAATENALEGGATAVDNDLKVTGGIDLPF